jgi:hypothetical protein
METEGNGRFYRKDRKGIRKERNKSSLSVVCCSLWVLAD